MTRDYVQIAISYANRVISGEILSCKAITKACQRFIDDLARAETGNWRYSFDAKKAERPCKFIEMLPHTKGKWARDKLNVVLSDFQVWIVVAIFGFARADNPNIRRVQIVYLKLPRKNGKSLLAACIGLYMLCADKEFGPEVYSGATTEKQAWEVFKPAKLIAEKMPALRSHYGLDVWAQSIQTKDGGKFEPLIGKPGDGASPSCAITDEFHEHDTSEQVDTMITGMGAREQPLSLRITTAGYNIAGPCYDEELYAKKVLDGTITDDAYFAAIWEADLEDDSDWTRPEAYIKANPNIGVSVFRDFLDQRLLEAINSPAHRTRFKTKHLNIWCNAKNAWLDMLAWHACPQDSGTNWPSMAEKKVIILDLASRSDICVILAMAAVQVGGNWHYYIKGRYYLPENAIENAKEMRTTLRGWVDAGHLTRHEGTEIDFERIAADAKADIEGLQISEVAHDPWRASHLVQTLDNINMQVVEYGQTVKHMSLPMKELGDAVLSKRVHHDGNPVLTWCMSNIVAKTDAKDNIYPRKERAHLKIDGGVAAIMGVGRIMPRHDASNINPPASWNPEP